MYMSKRNPNAASVPQGGITVRYGGGIAPKADIVTVPQGDDIRAATIGSGRLRASCETGERVCQLRLEYMSSSHTYCPGFCIYT